VSEYCYILDRSIESRSSKKFYCKNCSRKRFVS